MNTSCPHSPPTWPCIAAYLTLFSLHHRDDTERSDIFPKQNQQENPNSVWQPSLYDSDQQKTSQENMERRNLHSSNLLCLLISETGPSTLGRFWFGLFFGRSVQTLQTFHCKCSFAWDWNVLTDDKTNKKFQNTSDWKYKNGMLPLHQNFPSH